MDTPPDMARDVGHEIIKAAPPLTVLALTLNEWLALVSILYVAMQIAFLLWKWRGELKRRRRAHRDA